MRPGPQGDWPLSVTFGSAHLLVNRMEPSLARALLVAAVDAGATRLDTAPLYGHGQAEALVCAVVQERPGVAVTTKVGLEPQPAPPAWRYLAGRLARQVPAVAAVARRVRGSLRSATAGNGDPQALGPSGRFAANQVRTSVERSLRLFGRLDRLLLHEVHPADIDDELLRLLNSYQRRGDVRQLGVATGNGVTAAALQRGGNLFSVAHISADAQRPSTVSELRAAAALQGRPLHIVGHGILGAEARTLALLAARLREDAELAARWRAAVAGTRFADHGLARALCARAAAQGFDELLVATSKMSRVDETVQAAALARQQPLPTGALALLDDVFGQETPRSAPPAVHATPDKAARTAR